MLDTLFTTLFFIGALGLLVMAVFGGLHFGHSHPGHSGGFGHGARGGGHVKGGGAANGPRAARNAGLLMSALSPMTIFGLCLGAGATGLLMRGLHLARPEVVAAAIAGAFAFQLALIRPTLSLIVRFASKPSVGMGGTIAQEAEVLTPFDENGRGVVRLTVDGQVVRALATLDSDDRAAAGAPSAGEKVTVIAVDSASNSCRVARI